MFISLSVLGEEVFSYNGAFEQRKIAAAEFALEELRRTSDTGVYDSIKLNRVLNAEEEDGIFHDNMIMELELGSPHFINGDRYGIFNVVVMRHKETGHRSLAIDEFPLMDEKAIEKYWIDKVNRKRAEREAAFRQMELEALLMNDEFMVEQGIDGGPQEQPSLEEALRGASVDELLTVLEEDVPEQMMKKRQASELLLGHMDRYGLLSKEYPHTNNQDSLVEDDELLQSLTLKELYTVSLGSQDGLFSDYLVYRARQILDATLSRNMSPE